MTEVKPGGGKYDDLCTLVRERADAAGVVLIVIDGNKGCGFSAAATLEVLSGLPDHLRSLANGIEQTYKEHPGGFLGCIIDKCMPSTPPPDEEPKH